MGLVTKRRWALMCFRLPGGAWLIGPGARSVITAALEDAVAYRDHGTLNGPDTCNGCPTARDVADCKALGMDPPGPCEDHQLDMDAAAAYDELLGRIGVRADELAKLEEALYAEDPDA